MAAGSNTMTLRIERCSWRTYLRIRGPRVPIALCAYVLGAVNLALRAQSPGIADGWTYGLVMAVTVPVVIYVYLRFSFADRGDLARFRWNDAMGGIVSSSGMSWELMSWGEPAVLAVRPTLRGAVLVADGGRLLPLEAETTCTALVFWHNRVIALRFETDGVEHQTLAAGWVTRRLLEIGEMVPRRL